MWYNVLIISSLVILSGIFAGLTLALFSIKLTTLERKIRLGDKRAEKVYKFRKYGNLLLCVLLLANVSSYTIMTILLGSIANKVIAGFVATILTFIFAEILPQAIFPRYALAIGAKLSWLIWIALVIFYPIAAPIAWVLDKMLGKEPPVRWSKKEITEIIKYHEEPGVGLIDKDEARIVLGALSFSDMKVASIMVPLADVFYLESGTVMSNELLNKIRTKGFSRVPVYNSHDQKITGILNAKNLIGFHETISQTIDELCNKEPPMVVSNSMNLDDLLNLLVNHKIRIAMVADKNRHFSGVVTIEDIMEEILKTELED